MHLPADPHQPQIRHGREHRRPRSHDDVVPPRKDFEPRPIPLPSPTPHEIDRTLPKRLQHHRRRVRQRVRLGDHHDARGPCFDDTPKRTECTRKPPRPATAEPTSSIQPRARTPHLAADREGPPRAARTAPSGGASGEPPRARGLGPSLRRPVVSLFPGHSGRVRAFDHRAERRDVSLRDPLSTEACDRRRTGPVSGPFGSGAAVRRGAPIAGPRIQPLTVRPWNGTETRDPIPAPASSGSR